MWLLPVLTGICNSAVRLFYRFEVHGPAPPGSGPLLSLERECLSPHESCGLGLPGKAVEIHVAAGQDHADSLATRLECALQEGRYRYR